MQPTNNVLILCINSFFVFFCKSSHACRAEVTLSMIVGVLSIMSVLRKEMEKYRDIDEDELLKKLSEEELKRLEDELEELDPDVSL